MALAARLSPAAVLLPCERGQVRGRVGGGAQGVAALRAWAGGMHVHMQTHVHMHMHMHRCQYGGPTTYYGCPFT